HRADQRERDVVLARRLVHPREIERGRDDRARRRLTRTRSLTERRASETPRLHARGRNVGVDDRAVLLAVRVDGARARGGGREEREEEHGKETHRRGSRPTTLLNPPPEPQEMALVSAGLRALQDDHAPAVRFPGARRRRRRPVVRAGGRRAWLG